MTGDPLTVMNSFVRLFTSSRLTCISLHVFIGHILVQRTIIPCTGVVRWYNCNSRSFGTIVCTQLYGNTDTLASDQFNHSVESDTSTTHPSCSLTKKKSLWSTSSNSHCCLLFISYATGSSPSSGVGIVNWLNPLSKPSCTLPIRLL